MTEKHLNVAGIVVPHSALAVTRARWFADVLGGGGLNYVKMIDCVRNDAGLETVIFDVEVEIPQVTVNEIDRVERIAVRFSVRDAGVPEVLALRRNFPWVPHTNLREQEFPRSLCLYDVAWDELRSRWTPAGFVERIRYWLAESAKATLHQGDQPLEPMLLDNGQKIILPPNLLDGAKDGECRELWITYSAGGASTNVLRGVLRKPDAGGLPFVALSFRAKPQMHGCIRHQPNTIGDLEILLSKTGIDFFKELRQRLSAKEMENSRNSKLLLVIAFPLTRNGSTSVEASDIWTFLTLKDISETGKDIGLWQSAPGCKSLGTIIGSTIEGNGSNSVIEVMKPVFALTRKSAAAASGFNPDSRRVAAIGTGAIGSETIKLLAKSGFGKWSLIDDDILLPHNLTKHSLGAYAVGAHKVAALAVEIDGYYDEEEKTVSIAANVLHPYNDEENVKNALTHADTILDLSASVSVSRHISRNIDSTARRLSLFLNPRGTDLIVMAEDAARAVTLDCLEMQYLREVANRAEFKDHLRQPEGRIRYARSCRDVSSVIPNHLIAIHSAIGARAVRDAVAKDEASLQVWRVNDATLEVSHVQLSVYKTWTKRGKEWTIISDKCLDDRLSKLRKLRLPRETGGVLIGSFDMERRIAYVVDTILSPPDSEEWPTAYIRGSAGLAQRVDEIQKVTGGQLQYVGEWHSHPDGCSCSPSEDDRKLFKWLMGNMANAGLPALVAIAGQRNSSKWIIGEIE